MSVALAPAYNAGSWHTFFTLTGTAAATLTGLFFVAFSSRAGVAAQSGASDPGALPADLADRDRCRSVVRTARGELPAVSVDLIVRWLGMGATWVLSIGSGISLLAGSGGGLYLLGHQLALREGA